ncbi:MAG: lipase family protein [Actinomycetota bacterium]|nr:lipase family protein [Actinomycetota bacterium]
MKRAPGRAIAGKKRLPDITWETLDEYVLPPIHDYAYFEGGHDHPFLHGADEFEAVNAWWLAEASMLAYAQPPFATPRFRAAGLEHVRFFSTDSTQCYVAHTDAFVIVAFRGSEIRKRAGADGRGVGYIVADWRADLGTGLVDSGRGASVHRGFKQALDEVWNPRDGADGEEYLGSYLERIANEGGLRRSVWFTGHSLGGALATLAAERYGGAAGLYTFGSPRVGDRAFADHFSINSYRFVHNDDVVAKVPPVGLYRAPSIVPKLRLVGSYRHVGRLKYINSTDNEGAVLDDPSLWGRIKNNFTRVVRNTFNLRHLVSGGKLPGSSLIDHAPIFYATHLWNDYVRDLHRTGPATIAGGGSPVGGRRMARPGRQHLGGKAVSAPRHRSSPITPGP